MAALRDGEKSVGELVATVAINQPGVSKQMQILHEAGFVTVRRDAQRRVYALQADAFREVETWLDSYRDIWSARFDKLAHHLDQKNWEVET